MRTPHHATHQPMRLPINIYGRAGEVTTLPRYTNQITKKRLFRGREYAVTCILSKLMYRFQLNFAQHQGPPSAHRGWSKYAPNEFKMSGGRHFENR